MVPKWPLLNAGSLRSLLVVEHCCEIKELLCRSRKSSLTITRTEGLKWFLKLQKNIKNDPHLNSISKTMASFLESYDIAPVLGEFRHRLRPRQLLHKRLHPHLQLWRWDLVREVNQQWRMFFFFCFFPCFSIMQIPILFSLLTCLESEDEAELSSRVLGWGCGSRTCTISCTRPKVDCWALTFQMFCCGVRTV